MKRTVMVIGGVAAALALAAGTLVLTFDIDKHKPRIEAAASAAAGMKVSIVGKMRLKLFPRASLSAEDLFIQNRGAALALVPLSVAHIRLLPLFRGEVRIRELVLKEPKVFISKDVAGRYNFERSEGQAPGKGPAAAFLDVQRIVVTGGNLRYRDEATNKKIEANACNLVVQNLLAGGGQSTGSPSFSAEFSCRDAGTKEVRVLDLRAALKAGGGKLEASPVTMKIFGGDGRGSIRRASAGEPAEYAVDFAVTRLRFEELLGRFRQKRNVVGELNLALQLTMRGGNAEAMTRTARGTVSLRGQNLLLENLDVDRLLEKAEKSQHFNLVDMGAFLVAGPLGTVLTKGYDFGSVYREIPGAKGTIRKLVSDWNVSGGVAEAHDVAFATDKNRFALKGKLDFVHDRFEDLSVAVLNAKGCALSSQRIHGDFRNPQIDPPLPRRSVLGPVFSLLRKPFEMLQGGECKVFYHGSVGQP